MSTKPGSGLFIGLMSGTSLDGVDCALVDLSDSPSLAGSRFLPYSPGLKAALLALSTSGDDEIERAGRVSIELTKLYAAGIEALLRESRVAAGSVEAIGCHGQTVRHRPESGFTLQLVNPALLVEATGITVVTDFRNRDIAAGGQGAPLVPAFHAACFRVAGRHRVVINIGGIANLTDLPAEGAVRGFDSGPGNILLDAWAHARLGAERDEGGRLASTGTVIPDLLARMLDDEYFDWPPPKSTGRERFNARWLSDRGADRHGTADVQATLAELTARTIGAAVERYCADASEVYACGGGVHNLDLMRRLQSHLGARRLDTTEALGLHPDWVEAMAFAWLAKRALDRAPGNLPEVTGASGLRILGAVYPA